jgi:hypothetical protein
VNVWRHLSDLDRAGRELSRVLMPDGKLLIITANPGGYSEWESMHFGGERTVEKITGGFHLPEGIDLPEHVLFTHQLSDLTESLQRAGLAVQNMEALGRGSYERGEDWFIAIQGCKEVVQTGKGQSL